MDLHRAALAIHRSPSAEEGFHALAEFLGGCVTLHCAVWVGLDAAAAVCAHPTDARVPHELLEMGRHVAQPEVFPVGALSPVASARFPGAEMLFLPLRRGGAAAGTVVLIAGAGAFDEELDAWSEVGVALELAEERHRLLREAREEREAHRKRAQEMEALDVLGLAANQTLDLDEVLALVARFTRTLLGAHYAIVNTSDGEEVRACAWVGLRPGPDPDGDPLARRVIRAEQPVALGEGGEPFSPDDFPLHAAQQMHVGLGVPLALFGETFGALVVGYRDPYPFTARDTLLALTLARHAAVAINNARLHAQLAARSAELERAYRDLHESTRLKERFFASISHELRTPVNGILGFQTLLLDGVGGEIPAGSRPYLEKSNRAARNLLHLVDELLDYARIEAGKMEVHPRPVSVRELLEDAVCTVEPLAAQKGLRLAVSPGDRREPLHTDPDRVRQILLNLLSNAVKFTSEGEIALGVAPAAAAERGQAQARWLEICVRDGGPGIAPADQEAIFREFEQVKGTQGGTGLGLPISRKLARLLGGDLFVESELGRGATFVLRLPDPVPHDAA